MLCHLTPYFHLLTHLILFILKFGPVYAWWAYVYERFNGWLAKVNHNGHKGGELEATLMRSWTKLHLIHDLILKLSSLGDDKTPEDDMNIDELQKCLQGRDRPSQSRGTLLNTIALMSAEASGELIQFPKHGPPGNLRAAGLYTLVFHHLARAWAADVDLVPDTSFAEEGSPLIAISVPFFSHVLVAGQRYGVSTSPQGVKYRSTDLGIDVWKYGQLGPLQVIDVRQFSGHFALNRISSSFGRLWVTMSICHDSQEPDRVDIILDGEPY
ncbi:hypothetical protein C2E23DRAFT_889746 [Lenzites betulinus]|nr:hypothetical protein C2E23DRAFT_889746 [Lenzites betulinus]